MTDPSPVDQCNLDELDTILFRLAIIDTESKLISVLHRLLPNILPICNNTTQQIRSKVIQIIEHINTRLHTLTPQQQYQCIDIHRLYELYINSTNNDSLLFTTMLTMFMDKWFSYNNTATTQSDDSLISDKQRYGSKLLINLHQRTIQQQYNILYIFIQTIQNINYIRIEPDILNELYIFLNNPADKKIVFQYFIDILLYTTAINTSKQSQQKQNAAQNPLLHRSNINAASDTSTPAPITVPEGMSFNTVQLLQNSNKSKFDYNQLKLNILYWLSWVPLLADSDVLPLALIGSCVGNDSVNKLSDDIIRKCSKLIDYNHHELIKQLVQLYIGNSDNKNIDDKDKRAAININLKVKIINIFNKSTYAATLIIQSFRIIFDGLFVQNTTYKLKLAALQYCSYFINNAPLSGLTSIGTPLLNGLIKFLSTHSKLGDTSTTITPNIQVGTNTMINDTNNDKTLSTSLDHYIGQLRGITYNLIGQLSYRLPALVNTNTKLLQLYFNALGNESDDQILQNIHEGLSLLRSSYIDSSNNSTVQHELDSMLLQAIESDNRRVRLNAIQCTNKLFTFDHISSRYACLLLCNDTSIEVRDEAKRGLIPFELRDHKLIQENHNKNNTINVDTSDNSNDTNDTTMSSTTDGISTSKPSKALLKPIVHVDVPYPNFDDMMQFIYSRLELNNTEHIKQIDAKLLEHTIQFLYTTLESNAQYTKHSIGTHIDTMVHTNTSIQQLTLLIEHTFQSPVADTQTVASTILYKLISCNPLYFAPLYSTRLSWLKQYLFSNTRDIRINMASILTVVAEQFDDATLYELLNDLYNTLLQSSISHSITQQDNVHGSILGIGVVIAELIKSNRQTNVRTDQHNVLIRNSLCQLIDRLTPDHMKRDTSLVAATCISIARIAHSNQLPLSLVSEYDLDQVIHNSTTNTSIQYSRYTVVHRLLQLTKGTERKLHRLSEEAVTAVGYIGAHDCNTLLVKYILIHLFQLSHSKIDELHFVIGDALATIGNRTVQFNDDINDTQQLHNIIEQLKLSSSMNDVLNLLIFNSTDKPLMSSIVRVIIDRLIDNGNQLQRYSAVIWLLSIIKYNSLNQSMVNNAVYIQDALIRRGLNDKSVMSQECAGKAMSLLYQSSSSITQKQLIQSIQHRFGVGVKSDLLVVESNSLQSSEFDTTDSSSTDEYSTYRELTQIAYDMGNIALIYEFLDIASSHSLVLSHLHDKHGNGNSQQQQHNDMFTSTTPKQLQTLIPRLYRYIHDGSDKIRHIMSIIWNTVVDQYNGSVSVINEYYRVIMNDLIQKINHKNIRVRYSCVTGISELLYGRSYDELHEYLSELWYTIFRLLDDVNDDIRKSSQPLATQLHNVTVRLADNTYTTSKSHITSTLDIVIPILLHTGVTHRVQECQQLSLKTLLLIIKHSQRYLSPYLPDIIGVLLESFSSTENSQLQYLQFHTANYNLTDDQLENARINLARNSPYNDALVSCIQLIDSSNIHPVIVKLIDILRHGIGIPTLTAAARAVVTICQSSISNSLSNDTPQLIRVLQNGLTDSSITVRKLYGNALSYVLRVSKPGDITKCLQYIQSLYDGENINSTAIIEATDVNRMSAAYTSQLIIQHISDELRSYVIEPIATLSYIGQYDHDKDIGKQWTDVWNEINPSNDSGIQNHSDIIVQRGTHYLSSTNISYQLKSNTILSLINLVKVVKSNFTRYVQSMMLLCIELLPGRLWTGKYYLLQLISTIITECHSYMLDSDNDTVLHAIDAVVHEAIYRNKIEYKREAIRSIGLISLQYPAYIKFDTIKPTFDSIVNTRSNNSDVVMSCDNKTDSNAESEAIEFKQSLTSDIILQSYTYDCISQMWLRSSYNPFIDGELNVDQPPVWYQQQYKYWQWYIDTCVNGYLHNDTYNIRVSILHCMKRFIDNTWFGIKGVELDPCMTSDQCTRLLSIIDQSLHDTKYSVVRDAGIETLVSVLHRFELHSYITPQQIDIVQSTIDSLSTDTSATVLRYLSHAKSGLAELIEDRMNDEMQ